MVTGYTTFILKSKIHIKSTPQPTPQPTPIPTDIWKTNTIYNIGSNTIYNGNNYECNLTHLSSPPCAPGISVWSLKNPVPQIPVPQPQPIPVQQQTMVWGLGITYLIGTIVSYQGNTYKCLTAHTSIISWAPGIYTGALWFLIS